MQKKYNLSTIAGGLLLAPIPILFALFIYALITEPSLSNNYENNSYLKFLTNMVFAAYMIYVLFICPILLLNVYFINKYNVLNAFTLISTTYIYTILFFALVLYLKNGDWPNTLDEFKELFILNRSFILTASTAFTFWCYIKWTGHNNHEKTE